MRLVPRQTAFDIGRACGFRLFVDAILAKEESWHDMRVNVVARDLVKTEMGTRLAKAVVTESRLSRR